MAGEAAGRLAGDALSAVSGGGGAGGGEPVTLALAIAVGGAVSWVSEKLGNIGKTPDQIEWEQEIRANMLAIGREQAQFKGFVVVFVVGCGALFVLSNNGVLPLG